MEQIGKKFSLLVANLMQGKILNLDPELLHAVLGIGTEAGEIQDLVKKNMFYDKPFDILTLKAECSDLLHYIQMVLNRYGSSLEEIMEINIAKLTSRYPEGYARDKALVRNEDAEKVAMQEVEKKYEKGEGKHV